MNLFIGSSSKEVASKYYDNCTKLLDEILKINDINLVFGAFSDGLMGLCYRSFKNKNKKIIGITTKKYFKDLEDLELDRQVVCDNSFERCEKLYNYSDIILFLPGGIGTYSELLSILEEEKGKINNKLIILYNTNYFYTPFIENMYKLYQDELVDENIGKLVFISNNIDEIVNKIKERL